MRQAPLSFAASLHVLESTTTAGRILAPQPAVANRLWQIQMQSRRYFSPRYLLWEATQGSVQKTLTSQEVSVLSRNGPSNRCRWAHVDARRELQASSAPDMCLTYFSPSIWVARGGTHSTLRPRFTQSPRDQQKGILISIFPIP